MDFFEIKEREGKKKNDLDVYVDFQVRRSKDLMVRGKQFYAIWDTEKNLWSTDEYDVQRLVDAELRKHEVYTPGVFEVHKKYLGNFSSNSWMQFRNYIGHVQDNHHPLDSNITFKNTEVKKEDYVSHRLPYDLAPGDISAWDEIVGTLYDEENRAKIEWAIGAIVTGDSKTIQKFLVFYGAPGTGKSTIMNIIQWMFEGYWNAFVAAELVGNNNSFALEAFKNNPRIVIDHDGDLSKVQDNSKLNSLVAHEPMEINEKNKPKWMMRPEALLMVGSNKPVKITDSKSGLIRRILDIHPTGKTIPARKYQALMNQVRFELGAIAEHCRQVFLDMGKDYYAGYKPIEMMLQTDVFFNFIEANYDIFASQDGVTLRQAFEMYKLYIKESDIEYSLPQYKLREELKSYFENFEERHMTEDGERLRSYYSGFKADRFKSPTGKKEPQHMFALVMDSTESLFDREFEKLPAQYSKDDGTPRLYWDKTPRERFDEKLGKSVEFVPKDSQVVQSILKDLDTSREHYVKVPVTHIVIDFDLKDKDGKKAAERNLEVASTWPSTYAEFSKSGEGIHLHYNYLGDPTELKNIYDENIEVKVYTGNSSLRRRLTLCNNVPIADMAEGYLPLKEKKVMNETQLKSEKALRDLINRNLRKEIHPGTKPSIDFIHKILEDAYKSDLEYDVTDMRNKIFAFASLSSNNSLLCMQMVKDMKFASEEKIAEAAEVPDTFKSQRTLNADREVIYDVEVFPNLFVICWKYSGAPEDSIVAMVNPTAQEVEKLLSMKLVGFNNRRYDNHILYGAYMGMTNKQLYHLSKNIVTNVPNSLFGEAFNISWADIYDVSSIKMGLKKWEIELGINHMELGFDWDSPVDEKDIPTVVKYCKNDVEATDIVRQHLNADFIARAILADLSGLPMNATTQNHTSKIVFGDDRKPQDKFVYTDLSEMFPGYEYKLGKSTYREEVTGEGGYVYSEPGMYEDVAVLDVASMHPTSIEALNLFGEYTKNFAALKEARIAIKRKDYDKAKQLMGGKLARHLDNPDDAKALSYALKIVINIVYGLTSAKFDNSFRDPRNVDNIVAKRGALFMIDLKHEVQAKGFQVVHIKTDSIKIPNATPEIIEFVMEFGKKYGYEFEHEETFSKFCLVNDAVYIAKIGWHATEPEKVGTWEATGAQFAHAYVYKTLFSKEPLHFRDYCETKSIAKGSGMFLDYTGLEDTPMALAGDLNENDMKFVGRTGQFTPVESSAGGGVLVREADGKFSAVTGTKGYLWMESEMIKDLKLQDSIDMKYFNALAEAAIAQIRKFGDYEWFIS